jgi:hypothetical protein
MNDPSTRTRKAARRGSVNGSRKRTTDKGGTPLSKGAAAAQRASAGMGTEDLEPTDWLFGDSLTKIATR